MAEERTPIRVKLEIGDVEAEIECMESQLKVSGAAFIGCSGTNEANATC